MTDHSYACLQNNTGCADQWYVLEGFDTPSSIYKNVLIIIQKWLISEHKFGWMKQKSNYGEFTKEELGFLTVKMSRARMITGESRLGSDFSDLLPHHPQQPHLPPKWEAGWLTDRQDPPHIPGTRKGRGETIPSSETTTWENVSHPGNLSCSALWLTWSAARKQGPIAPNNWVPLGQKRMRIGYE